MPGGSTFESGTASVRTPVSRFVLVTLSSTARWSPSTRCVVAVRRISTMLCSGFAGVTPVTVAVKGSPFVSDEVLTLAIAGRSSRNTYHGLKISKLGSRPVLPGPVTGGKAKDMYEFVIGEWPPTSTRPSRISKAVLW